MATREDFKKIVEENQDDFEGCIIPAASYGRFLIKITAEAVLKFYTDEELADREVADVMCETFYYGFKRTLK